MASRRQKDQFKFRRLTNYFHGVRAEGRDKRLIAYVAARESFDLDEVAAEFELSPRYCAQLLGQRPELWARCRQKKTETVDLDVEGGSIETGIPLKEARLIVRAERIETRKGSPESLDSSLERACVDPPKEYLNDCQNRGGVGVRLPPDMWERYLKIRRFKQVGRNWREEYERNLVNNKPRGKTHASFHPFRASDRESYVAQR